MGHQDKPQAVPPEEDARTVETPATFANKVYLTPLPGGAKFAFAETRRVADGERVSTRPAVFLHRLPVGRLRTIMRPPGHSVVLSRDAGRRRGGGGARTCR